MGAPDGLFPFSGVIFDGAGNLDGATALGGNGGGILPPGTVYQLVPSGGGWTENILHNFPDDGSQGADPVGGLIFDSSGNLYGTTLGSVFKMTKSGGNFTLLYSFTSDNMVGPYGSLIMDGAGNLYGTTLSDGAYGYGNVFKLSPSGGGWTYTSLHDFCPDAPVCSDGANPYVTVALDANGNLYGTASLGGNTGPQCDPTETNQCGVIWEITP